MLKLFFYTLLVFFQSYVIQDIDKHQVKNLLNNEVTVIDVRTEKEYLIYCASGNRSLKASHIMKSLGFKTIYNYKKGYKDWIKD